MAENKMRVLANDSVTMVNLEKALTLAHRGRALEQQAQTTPAPASQTPVPVAQTVIPKP